MGNFILFTIPYPQQQACFLYYWWGQFNLYRLYSRDRMLLHASPSVINHENFDIVFILKHAVGNDKLLVFPFMTWFHAPYTPSPMDLNNTSPCWWGNSRFRNSKGLFVHFASSALLGVVVLGGTIETFYLLNLTCSYGVHITYSHKQLILELLVCVSAFLIRKFTGWKETRAFWTDVPCLSFCVYDRWLCSWPVILLLLFCTQLWFRYFVVF